MGKTSLFFEVENKYVFILGTGEVATRRAHRFLDKGANVILAGNSIDEELTEKGDKTEMIQTIGIIGLGAVGGMYADILRRHYNKDQVICIAAADRIERYKRDGVFVNGSRLDISYVSDADAQPVDLLIIMLGTNDVLLGAESEDTAAQMARFLKALKEALPGCTLLLCAPPPVTVEGKDFTPVFAELASAYEALARELGVLFADTAPWDIPTVGDGVHFSARGHVLFALKMGQTLRALLPG